MPFVMDNFKSKKGGINIKGICLFLTEISGENSDFNLFEISVSYCMVCAYMREDIPRALASGLSPVIRTTIQ